MNSLVNGRRDDRVPADDPGFLRGLVCFDTLRTYGRHPFRLEQHLRRLERSAEAMGIPCDLGEVAADMSRLLDDDVWIRVTLTAGGNRVIQSARVDMDRVGRPLRCARWPVLPSAFLPGSVKHGNRAAWILAARGLGVDEVLFEHDGQLLEANRSSLVAVLDGVARTPPTDGRMLEGVTRGALLDAARLAGLPLIEAPIPSDGPFDELWVASTLKELAPVAELDGVAVGGGGVGESLHRAFRDLVQSERA